ncbi:MAG: hypothetical protein AB7F19_06615 [Candidatus Babeliales bacterium]
MDTITFSGSSYPNDSNTIRDQKPRISQETANIRSRIESINNPDTIPSGTFPKNNNYSEYEFIEERDRDRKRAEKERRGQAENQKQKEEKIIQKEVAKKLLDQSNRISSFTQQTSSSSHYAKQDKSPDYITKRATYLKKFHDDPDYYYRSTVYLRYSNYQTRSLLEQHTIDTDEFYNEFFGNHLQHGIHEEYLNIVSRVTKINFDKNNCQLRSFIVLAVQTSRDNNVKGNCVTSLEINDFCHHILNPNYHGFLAGQIAHLQTTITYYESSHWKQALGYLADAALGDQEMRACLNAAQKFTEQFNIIRDSQYNVQVIEIMEQLSFNELSDLTAQRQFELLEKHHEAIAIKALRALNQQNIKDLPIFGYAVSILKLDNPHNASNRKLIDYLLYSNDCLHRVHELTNTPYSSFQQKNPFFTDKGILKEYAIIADIDNLPIPPLDHLKSPVSAHDLLYTYCTTNKLEKKKLAYSGLYHATYATIHHHSERSKGHELLADKYYKTLYSSVFSKNEKLIDWCDDLACSYENVYQQEVHDELVWLTNYYIDTQEKSIKKDAITLRLLDDIEDTLITAHGYNQDNQSEKSHDLIANIVHNFGMLPKENQKTPDLFQSLNLLDVSRNISNKIQARVAHIKVHAWLNDYNLEETLEYARHELSKMEIQHGKLICQADSIQERPDEVIQSLCLAEVLGFSVKTDADTIDIGCIPKKDLATFKDNWPEEEVVQNVFNLWPEEVPLCSAGSQGAAYERYADRYDAYQETKLTPYVFFERTYEISKEAQQLLDKNGIDSDYLKVGTYNRIQHQLHIELIDILEQTTSLDAHQEVCDLLRSTNTMMLDFISSAAYENKNGNILRTWTIADFCWATLDCGQAILEGALEGGANALIYPFNCPVETILFTVAGKYMLYYQLTKLTYELGSAVYDHLSKEQEENTSSETKTAIQLRDILKAASSFGAQFLVDHKIVNPIVTQRINLMQSKLVDKFVLENTTQWSKMRPEAIKAPQTAQVQLASGEKIEVTFHNENLGQRPQGLNSPQKPRNSSGDKKEYPRPSPEEIDRNRVNKNLADKARKQKAIDNASQKVERTNRQKINTAQNIQDAQICILHKYDELEKIFYKHLSPHAEFLYKKFGIRIKGIDFYHHMERDFNQNIKGYTGFHSARNHPEHVFKLLDGPNEHGFENIIVGSARKIKKAPTSTYPKNWDEITIGQRVIEGLLSGEVHKNKGGILEIHGKAQNYLPHRGVVPFDITIFLEPSGMIRSSFPQLNFRK